jgi:hypothetical protein
MGCLKQKKQDGVDRRKDIPIGEAALWLCAAATTQTLGGISCHAAFAARSGARADGGAGFCSAQRKA